jgi:ferredoxin
MVVADEELNWLPASAFLIHSAQDRLEQAAGMMGRQLPNPDELPEVLLNNLEHPEFDAVSERCMRCGSCTQVCPTCFCWEVVDNINIAGDETTRVRMWDSCFNIEFSHVFGGNMRPRTHSRYRQWLTHKFASWYHQFGASGCVGCGRCISWCPAGIDPTEEIAVIREVN